MTYLTETRWGLAPSRLEMRDVTACEMSVVSFLILHLKCSRFSAFGEKTGPLSPSAANQAPLTWDPDMEEASEEPPYLILPNEYFTVYEHGRRNLLSGQHPPALDGQHGIRARAWRAYQNRMGQEPAWERAERYRRMMREQGSRSIRALARATGGDHSRMARAHKVLELPERVLEALRAHTDNPRVRAYFSERRLRQMVRQNRPEMTILQELEQVVQDRIPSPNVPVCDPATGGRSSPRCGSASLT